MKIAVNKGWNPEDIDFLVSLSTEDFYRWMVKSPADLPIKIRNGLLFFKNLQAGNINDGKKYLQIFERTREALLKLGMESPLNMKRIRHLYDIGEEVELATKVNKIIE
jgi:hypothetical protein